jgi:hypothetical protein
LIISRINILPAKSSKQRSHSIRKILSIDEMNPLQKETMTTELVITLLLIGLAAGILSGMVGVGGGLIVVPALIFFLGYSQHRRRVLPWDCYCFPWAFLPC